MSQQPPKKTKQPLEGEGNYTATRRYNEHVREATSGGKLDGAAEAARRAVEGPAGPELERAREQAKKGPRPEPTSSADKTRNGGKQAKTSR